MPGGPVPCQGRDLPLPTAQLSADLVGSKPDSSSVLSQSWLRRCGLRHPQMAGCGDACDQERLYRNPLHRGQGGGWQLAWVWVGGQEGKDLETPAEKDTQHQWQRRGRVLMPGSFTIYVWSLLIFSVSD